MTTKMHWQELLVVILILVIGLAVLLWLIINVQFDKNEYIILIALYIIPILLLLLFSQLYAHGGFFTDSVSISEDGITFKTKKETISYFWNEIDKIHYSAPRGMHTFYVYPTKRPNSNKNCFRFSCSTKFKKYLYTIYPNIQ